ncbi:uncharacterized protein [Primulina huaijiensis]|uniref:uncharacterized protein n=1 Tax=Primulina huaijiensis TaxID=1492673 RepID=UPI003CC72FCC
MARLPEQHVGNTARVRPEDVYERFRRINPKEFSGTTDPFVAERWIRSLKVIFRYMDMADANRVLCTIYLLKDDASLWRDGAERGVNLTTLAWKGFKRVFIEKYFTVNVCSRLKREFISLLQGDSSVFEFVKKFDRGCHFEPLIANDAAEKLRHFLDGLRLTVHQDVLLRDLTSYNDAITRAFRAKQSLKDIEWDMQKKRPHPQQQLQQRKKPFTGPPKHPGQQKPQRQPPREAVPKIDEKPFSKECYRHHFGKCMWSAYKCFRCGRSEHKAADFPKQKQPMIGRAFLIYAEQVEPDTMLITGIPAI